MLRRGSTISSAKSVSSPIPNGLPTPGYSRPSAGLAPSLQSAQSTKQSFGFDTLNPDDLFSRYTVAEVKNIQARLRNDADIKQEELRLMVGERYRDLLQASTSIISMAASSRRVLDAIEECRGSIIAQEEPPMPSRSMGFGGSVNDRHLHTLQLLSAHVKVLLDAPEHLWRLIERKDYLSAAWLFLFTRVVHRALTHQDDQDEDSWSKIGIDVLAEFPLVQRQWDEISSFRSQIIHKSSLSLRETKSSSQAVCATLITLHLLDSRPLREAFSALLTQRTKALTALISWKYHTSANARPTARFGSKLEASTSRPSTAKEILQANEKVLTAIIDTVHTSRQIFQIPPDQQASLISSALHRIQEEKPRSGDVQVPQELVPSTHNLLTNSSSSAHFLLLPAALQSYKPYIDLESSSLIYSQADFRQALHDWLQKSTKSWRGASSNWLTELGTVGQIWNLRSSLRGVVSEAQLEEAEKRELANTLDGLCHDRILAVWKATLEKAQDNFQAEFAKFLSSSKDRIEPRTPFRSSAPPSSSQTSKQSDSAPFQQYQTALKQQLLGRTAQLDAVLSTLEQAARIIQADLATVLSDETSGGIAFGKSVTDTYQSIAESTAESVVSVLEKETEQALDDLEISRLVGLANVSDELRSSSVFVTHIGCRKPALGGLRLRLDSVFERVVFEWQGQTVTRVFDGATPSSLSSVVNSSKPVYGPSPQCFQSLLSLSDALRELGVGQHNVRHETVVQVSLRALIDKYLTIEVDLGRGEQHLYDFAFLKAISRAYGAEWDTMTQALGSKLGVEGIDDTKRADIELTASDYLIKTQTLLSVLLPCAAQVRLGLASSAVTSPTTPKGKDTLGVGASQANFLLFGNPSALAKQEYQPALDLAKPGSRFGLLLVSSVEN